MPLNDLATIDPKTRNQFRKWLKLHFNQKSSVWVKVYKKFAGPGLISTNDIVEECLCFGWVDSRPKKNDLNSFLLLISPRKPNSVWSKVNKEKVEILLKKSV